MNEPVRLSASGSPLAKQLLLAGKRERPRPDARSEATAAALLIATSRRSWLYTLGSWPWLALLALSLMGAVLVGAVTWLPRVPSTPEPAPEAESIERPVSFEVPPRVPESFMLAQRTTAPPTRAPAAAPNAVTAPPAIAAERRPTELDLLRGARIALVNADPARTLALLEEHTTLFPRGALREEAAALRVEALARSGDVRAAREAAARFAVQFPESPYGERIRSISAGLPRP